MGFMSKSVNNFIQKSWELNFKIEEKLLKEIKFIYNVKYHVCATYIRQNQMENYCYTKIVKIKSDMLSPHRVVCFLVQDHFN